MKIVNDFMTIFTDVEVGKTERAQDKRLYAGAEAYPHHSLRIKDENSWGKVVTILLNKCSDFVNTTRQFTFNMVKKRNPGPVGFRLTVGTDRRFFD